MHLMNNRQARHFIGYGLIDDNILKTVRLRKTKKHLSVEYILFISGACVKFTLMEG